MPDTVLYETRDHVAYITLNKPDKLNALDDAMLDAVVDGGRRGELDDDVKCVVIKGNGKCFSSGWDLEEIGRMYGIEDVKSGERARRPPQRNALMLDRRRSEKFAAILLSMKTTIAQVQRLGASGTMWTLPLVILHCGPKKGRELLLTGRDFSAAEAERLNLVNKVVPADKLEAEVDALTQAISLLPRDGLAIGKAYTNMTYDLLRMVSPFLQYSAAHPLVAGMRWAPDETSFPKERRDLGAREAAPQRAERYPEEYR